MIPTTTYAATCPTAITCLPSVASVPPPCISVFKDFADSFNIGNAPPQPEIRVIRQIRVIRVLFIIG